MSLNVKDAEAHELARALAKETGETMTRAVTEALREPLPTSTRYAFPPAASLRPRSSWRRRPMPPAEASSIR